MEDIREGKIHAITGFAKFKTSSAFGTSLRAINQGWQVLIFQFLKGSVTGEVELLSKTFPKNVTIRRFGADKIILPNNVEAFDKDETQRGWNEMLELAKTDNYDLLILDEVFCALDLNLLFQYQYFSFLKEKPKKLEVISTGRVIDKALMRKITDASDLHTDAYMVKHYMNRKCPICKHTWKWSDNYCSYCGEQLPAPIFARKGIEL